MSVTLVLALVAAAAMPSHSQTLRQKLVQADAMFRAVVESRSEAAIGIYARVEERLLIQS